jgi:hypothetical protein
MGMVKKLFEAERPDQTTPAAAAADTPPDDDDKKRHTTSSASTRKPLSFSFAEKFNRCS